MMHAHARFATLAAAIAAVVVASGQGRGNPTEWPTAYGDAHDPQHRDAAWHHDDIIEAKVIKSRVENAN